MKKKKQFSIDSDIFLVCKNDKIEKFLVYSIDEGKLVIIKYLYKLDNRKPLLFNIKYIYGHEKVANCLLKHGVDINKVNKKGLALLHIASKYGYDNIVKKNWLKRE